MHRLEAYKLALPDIPIETKVISGTLEEARWFSYGMNATHGLNRTNADKNRAVRLALQHPMGIDKSNREIAGHVGVDEKLVRRVREQLESTAALPQSTKRLGRDGRVINTEKIGRPKKVENAQKPTDPAKETEGEPKNERQSPSPTAETSEPLSSQNSTHAPYSQQKQESEHYQPLGVIAENASLPEKVVCVPLDKDRLVTTLFDLFDVQYREYVLDTLARKMLAEDGHESVLKIIAPLYDDIRQLRPSEMDDLKKDATGITE